jgi:hypothetical protein
LSGIKEVEGGEAAAAAAAAEDIAAVVAAVTARFFFLLPHFSFFGGLIFINVEPEVNRNGIILGPLKCTLWLAAPK